MNENINPILKKIIDRTEEVSFLPDVRKDAEMNFYLLYTDVEGNIVNIWKEALEGKSHFILNRIRFNGYFRIGIIEKDRPVYVCSDWREALSIHTMQKAAVVLPSSKRSIRKVESILRAKGCIVRKPTIEAQIVAPIDNAPEAMHSIAKPQHIGNHPYPPEIPESESDVSYIGPALLEQFEHDEWHIRNFIPKGPFLGFIFSPSSYGKTFFALDMATFSRLGVSAAHWAKLTEELSQPRTKMTSSASFPWNVWTVPILPSSEIFSAFSFLVIEFTTLMKGEITKRSSQLFFSFRSATTFSICSSILLL